ncbi:MAG: hypothetical protein ACRC6U_03890 [Fusobacteriaceae bacterium]
MKKKKVALFTLLLLIAFYFCNIIFNRLDRKTFNILNFNKDKIDLVFVGSSHSYSTFNTRIFDNKLHINSYALSTDGQPIAASYYLLKEFYKKRKPEIIVLELYGLLFEAESKNSYENVFNSFAFGKNKIEASKIFETTERIDYLIPIIKYHAVWKEPSQLIKNILSLFPAPYKGSVTYWQNSTKLTEVLDKNNYLKENFEINNKNLEYLKLIIKDAEKNKIKIIYTVAPVISDEKNYEVLEIKNKMKRIMPEIKIIDFNSYVKELKINKQDFLDKGHLNSIGSTKISEYLSEYIQKNYKFIQKNYKSNKYFDEYYFYNTDYFKKNSISNLPVKIEDNKVKSIQILSKPKNLDYFLHLLDSYNVGVITKQKLVEFIKSKSRYNLYIEINPELYQQKDSYKIELLKDNKLIKTIIKNNKDLMSKDNKGLQLRIPQNTIWLINKKSYIVEKNIFLSEEINQIRSIAY